MEKHLKKLYMYARGSEPSNVRYALKNCTKHQKENADVRRAKPSPKHEFLTIGYFLSYLSRHIETTLIFIKLTATIDI